MPSVSRREFLLLGVATGAVAAVGVVVPLSIATKDSFGNGDGTDSTMPGAVVAVFPKVRVASLSALREAEPVIFDYPLAGQSNVLVKLGEPAMGGTGPDGDIVGFSRICTHMGCTLPEYRHEHKVLGPCPCHFTTFDLIHGGQVSLGQATQNLPQLLLTIEGDDIYATGVVRLIYGFADNLQGAQRVGGTT